MGSASRVASGKMMHAASAVCIDDENASASSRKATAMAFAPQIDVGIAQADVDVFAFTGAGMRSSGALPTVSVYYSANLAVAVEIYFAPVGGSPTDANRIYLVNETLASAARFCYPLWIATSGAVWHLFVNKPTTGGAGTAFLRIEYDAGGEGR